MSTLKVNNLQTASGGSNSTPEQIEQGRCKCWINFDGGAASIRDSFNVSSLADNGTGQYTVNFSTALSSSNYSVTTAGGGGTGSLSDGCNVSNLTTSSFFSHWGNGGSQYDFGRCFFSVFGDGA
tara:strand:- start:332 stop:703 length:372 start_codon:yes stop_codon:yes gene_type:complete